jgi:hypothetical protein
MQTHRGTCPLTQRQLVDEFFLEHRTKLLDIAAFLDRIDRAAEHDASDDFRLAAFRQALQVLGVDQPVRVERVQMMLSDPTVELLAERDRQNAYGAFGSDEKEAR